jgi:hypothetical protein
MTESELKREQQSSRLRSLLGEFLTSPSPAAFDALRAEFLAQASQYRQAAQERLEAYMAKVQGLLDPYFDAPGKSEPLARSTDEYHRLAGMTADFHDLDRSAPAAVIERFIAAREAFSALPAI